jgi:ribosomal protein L20
VLADMAVHDREGFARLAEIARGHLPVPAAPA